MNTTFSFQSSIPRKIGWPWDLECKLSTNNQATGISLPRVSIVTPSYNHGEYLEETIRSVLLQDYPNLEYWVMDGGSSDKSVEIIRKYEPWLTGWVSEKDRGQADAINKGWQRCTGDFLGWINSDDLLTPESISSVVAYFEEHPEVDLVYGDLEHINQQGQIIMTERYKDFDIVEIIKEAGWISQPGNLIRRHAFERIGYLDTSLDFLLDLDYWLRIALIGQLGYIRKPIARFRWHKFSKSTDRTYLAAKDIMYVYSKLFSRSDLPPEVMSISREAWGSAHLYAAKAWYSSEYFRESYQEVWKAILNNPGLLINENLVNH